MIDCTAEIRLRLITESFCGELVREDIKTIKHELMSHEQVEKRVLEMIHLRLDSVIAGRTSRGAVLEDGSVRKFQLDLEHVKFMRNGVSTVFDADSLILRIVWPKVLAFTV